MECQACRHPAAGSTEAYVTVSPRGADELSLLLASLPLRTWTRIPLCVNHLREMVERAEAELDDDGLWHPDHPHPTVIALGSRRTDG